MQILAHEFISPTRVSHLRSIMTMMDVGLSLRCMDQFGRHFLDKSFRFSIGNLLLKFFISIGTN